jgi:hypothetical protein
MTVAPFAGYSCNVPQRRTGLVHNGDALPLRERFQNVAQVAFRLLDGNGLGHGPEVFVH